MELKCWGRVARQFLVGMPFASTGGLYVHGKAMVDECLPGVMKKLDVWGHVV
jgi:hypothetical protein